MSSELPSRPRKSRNSGPEPPGILVEPTPETQAIYNQIREDEALQKKQHCLQQHVSSQDRLQLPHNRATQMSRSVTSESYISGSLSPGSTTGVSDPISPPTVEVPPPCGAKRPRGRRHGPLGAEKRTRTAIKRKLGLVCDHCKRKKIVCEHYDLSKFNEGYLTTKKSAQPDTAELDLEPVAFFGLDPNTSISAELSAAEDFTHEFNDTSSQPHSRQQHIHNLVQNFDVRSVSMGDGTLKTSFAQPYNPGIPTAQSSQTLSRPFLIGSEMSAYPGYWRCEYQYAGSNFLPDEDCRWSGRLPELKQHFTSEHCAFREEEYWCYCQACSFCTLGWDPPPQCLASNCYGGRWKKSIYGHSSIDTPALTQSGESEGELSFDARASSDQVSYDPSWSSR